MVSVLPTAELLTMLPMPCRFHALPGHGLTHLTFVGRTVKPIVRVPGGGAFKVHLRKDQEMMHPLPLTPPSNALFPSPSPKTLPITHSAPYMLTAYPHRWTSRCERFLPHQHQSRVILYLSWGHELIKQWKFQSQKIGSSSFHCS